jgi:hypothetical protein
MNYTFDYIDLSNINNKIIYNDDLKEYNIKINLPKKREKIQKNKKKYEVNIPKYMFYYFKNPLLKKKIKKC